MLVRGAWHRQWCGDRKQSTLWNIPAREDAGHGHGTHVAGTVAAQRDNDEGIAGAIINPSGYTRGYPALVAAIGNVGFPTIEVHISNIFARESWRRRSYVAPVAKGSLCGFGIDGYALAITGLAALVGAPVWAQALVFVLGSFASLGLLRPIARAHLSMPRAIRTGADALEGARAVVLERVDRLGQRDAGGHVGFGDPQRRVGHVSPRGKLVVAAVLTVCARSVEGSRSDPALAARRDPQHA